MGQDAPQQMLDSGLQVGVLLLAKGASTARVIRATTACLQALGATRADVSISSLTVSITIRDQATSLAATRKAAHLGIDLATVDALLEAIESLTAGRLDPTAFRTRVAALEASPPAYAKTWILIAVGAACAGLAGLSGGDAIAMLAAGGGAALGKAVQFAILGLHRPPAAAVLAAAFVASLVAGFAAQWSTTTAAATSATVLFLIPGVVLVNGITDLFDGHPLNGLSRLTSAAITLLAITVGLASAALLVHP